MKNLYNELFDFDVKPDIHISVSKNEIYNQLLLYIFFSLKEDLLIVTSNINESNIIYNKLRNYTEDIYLFPEDDFLTKKAIASTPELLFFRLNLLNNIKNKPKKIVVCNINSYLKKLENPKNYENRKIIFKTDSFIERNKVISKLLENGYKKESLVTNTGEFSVRGFVIDIFPIHQEKPIRIELFDDKIEKIKVFDENTQRTINEIQKIEILPINDEYNDNASTIINYLNDPFVILNDLDQIKLAEDSIKNQIEYCGEKISDFYFLKDIKSKKNIYIDLINNAKNYDYIFTANEIKKYNDNFKEFLCDLENHKPVYLFSTNDKINDELRRNDSTINIVKSYLDSGFEYNGIYYYSSNDLKCNKPMPVIDSGYKLGKRISSIDKLEIGDFVVHKANGIGVYMGISTIEKNHIKKDYILLKYKGNDKLYLPVQDINKLYKYSSKEGHKPTIHSLNGNEWKKTKIKIKERIKELTEELLKIYRQRSKASVKPFDMESPLEELFSKDFEHELTLDQVKAFNDIKRDMESTKPMDRLLCGDVGYGKTEVIFKAMFKAVINNKQVMYLCPTTLLSHQQYESALKRFANFGVNIAVLNRYNSKKEATEIIKKLKDNKIDIIFGTHRLLSDDIKFNDLGLLVIDEEQRFGVTHKEKMKKYKDNVHVLSVSATPIPRTLQMSLVGIRDLSLIETPPKNRVPIQTYVISYDDIIIREVVLKELSRQGQVFILYNKIQKMRDLVEKYKKIIPEAKIAYAHGAMSKTEIQDIMYEFVEGNFDVLVSTTIIENGIDIPNANTMIVVDADLFGLAQLYQIRGRVGRSDRVAYAYLMYNDKKLLSDDAKKRLSAIKEFTDLGSGYKISMRDLNIRGAGNLLGSEQAGFIDSVGVDLYIDLVNEEINNIEEVPEEKINIDDVETHIGKEYSEEDEIIIELHKKINAITSRKELEGLEQEIEDRFGKVEERIKDYIYQEYLKKLLVELDIEIFSNTERKIEFKIKDNIFTKLVIEELFVKATQICTRFTFKYKNNYILIAFPKGITSEKYIYYLIKLLEYIQKEINK